MSEPATRRARYNARMSDRGCQDARRAKIKADRRAQRRETRAMSPTPKPDYRVNLTALKPSPKQRALDGMFIAAMFAGMMQRRK